MFFSRSLLTGSFLAFIGLLNLNAQDRVHEISKAHNHLDDRGEVIVTFEVENLKKIQDYVDIMSVDHIEGKTVKAYANKKEFDKFLRFNKDFEVLDPVYPQEEGLMAHSVEEFLNWGSYPTYSVYIETMEKYARDYPEICRIEKIGKSTRGKDIVFLKISDNVGYKEPEPEVMYTSTMHGDETTGFPLMIRFIDYILTNYGKDKRVDKMVNNLEMWINPLFNPDGTYRRGDNSVKGSIRGNANNVDLNRNFPSPTGQDHPDGNSYQSETKVMMKFMEKHQFVLLANFHGGAEVVSYPWDKFRKRHVDDNWFKFISREYADLVHKNSQGASYFTKFNNGITNGFDWYELDGGRQDYAIHYLKGREVTIELSDTKTLDASKLDAHWGYNKESLLAYFEQALYGVRGIVTDSVTGDPLAANVKILQHDDANSVMRTEKENGDYYRMIKGGTYDIEYSSDDYKTKVIRGVSVQDLKATVLNVKLVPNDATSIDEVFENGIFVGNAPNPFSYKTEILVELPYSSDLKIEIFDVIGNQIKTFSRLNAAKGKHSFGLNGDGLKEGLYLYRVITPKHVIENKLLLTR